MRNNDHEDLTANRNLPPSGDRRNRMFLFVIIMLVGSGVTNLSAQPLLVDGRYGPVLASETRNAGLPMLYLVGGPGLSGRFQDTSGNPDPQGWQSVDRSVEVGPAVGNFGQLWSNLNNADNCAGNSSPQWAFIDDGLVQPGTGGTSCLSSCYGPSGYMVNTTGGLVGPGGHLWNEIWSPQIAWPGGGYNGGSLAFDMYLHQELRALAPGLFAVWHVRSTDNPNPAVTGDWTEWRDHGRVYYGGPNYVRFEEVVTDLLLPGATFVQVAIGVHQLGYLWGINGNDGTPGPYFDNFELTAYQIDGPTISASESNLAQDAMPTTGVLDLANLAANYVAVHRALDSQALRATVVAAAGQSLSPGFPRLWYQLAPNPVYDAFRTVPVTGVVAGIPTAIPDEFEFPLPATGFAFPGDMIHYYIEAEDGSGTTTLPDDPMTLGIDRFPGDALYTPGLYPAPFVFRALPSHHDDGFGGFSQVPILFWKDSPTGAGEAEWFTAFRNLGYVEGQDYDTYTTNLPSANLDNGLGGGATTVLLDAYETILYSGADLDYFTITGVDAALLDSWLVVGARNMFLTGNKLVSDMDLNGGGTTATFVTDQLGVVLDGPDVSLYIAGNTTALIEAIDPGWAVFPRKWIISGKCNSPHAGHQTFDAVTAVAPAIQAAKFVSVGTTQAAATRNLLGNGNEIVSLPYDLMYVLRQPNWPLKIEAPLSARAEVLGGVLTQFGYLGGSPASSVGDVPSVPDLEVAAFPNPFNPRLTLAFNLPLRGFAQLTIHDLQGRLVRTLLNQELPSGQQEVVWNGADDRGGQVASGTYFYRLQTVGGQQRGKIALIK